MYAENSMLYAIMEDLEQAGYESMCVSKDDIRVEWVSRGADAVIEDRTV